MNTNSELDRMESDRACLRVRHATDQTPTDKVGQVWFVVIMWEVGVYLSFSTRHFLRRETTLLYVPTLAATATTIDTFSSTFSTAFGNSWLKKAERSLDPLVRDRGSNMVNNLSREKSKKFWRFFDFYMSNSLEWHLYWFLSCMLHLSTYDTYTASFIIMVSVKKIY